VEFKEDDDRFEYYSPALKYIVMKPVENGECILDNTRTVEFENLMEADRNKTITYDVYQP